MIGSVGVGARADLKRWAVAVAGATGLMLGLTGGAEADIGLGKDGVFDGYGYQTDAVNIELYGLLDIGVGTLEHSYKGNDQFMSTINPYNLNSSPNRWTGIFSGGISASRFGLKGDTANTLPDDWKLFFRLEGTVGSNSGVLSNNGRTVYNNIYFLTTANGASAIDGQWFSRAAYVGVSNPIYGSLELGRTTNFSLDQVVIYDPVQNALLFSPLGFSGGIGGGLGATENTRFDNSLKYEKKFGLVTVGVQYKVPLATNDQEVESAAVGMISFENGPLALMGTIGKTNNTVAYATQYSNVVSPDPNLQIEDTFGFMVSGKYKVTDEATVKVGYQNTRITPPSDPNYTNIVDYYGLTLPSPAVNATGKQTFGTFWTGGDYVFFKDLDIAAAYYNVDTYNTPFAGKDYRSSIFSFLGDYTIRKGIDTYVGAMLLHYTGPGLLKKAPTDAFGQNALYGAGVRLRF
jgi:predicted porin